MCGGKGGGMIETTLGSQFLGLHLDNMGKQSGKGGPIPWGLLHQLLTHSRVRT